MWIYWLFYWYQPWEAGNHQYQLRKIHIVNPCEKTFFVFPKVILGIATSAQMLHLTGVKVMKGWTSEERTYQGWGGLIEKHLEPWRRWKEPPPRSSLPWSAPLTFSRQGWRRCKNYFLRFRVHCSVSAVTGPSAALFVPGRIQSIPIQVYSTVKELKALSVLQHVGCLLVLTSFQLVRVILLPSLRMCCKCFSFSYFFRKISDYGVKKKNVANGVFVVSASGC